MAASKVAVAARLLSALGAALIGCSLGSVEPHTAAPTKDGSELLNLVFTGDIGHSREHRKALTHPWPMDKSAFEGAFSLYEGLYDYVVNQGARPTAAIVVGDVAYGGGVNASLENSRLAFQKYLAGKVPEDRVFVNIGNHDVHYMGCTVLNVRQCYFGGAMVGGQSRWSMSFNQWRSNWLQSFQGLTKHAIAPPRHGTNQSGLTKNHTAPAWMAPMRYNLNLDRASSVYIIAGLRSGSQKIAWNGDTPPDSVDAKGNPDLECEFLRDSLAHGRSLGKTIFIYMTHHFDYTCHSWPLISQIDIWIYGHRHTYWQSALNNEVIMQEGRHYPVRLLIGNGGFDEGQIDVVSFGHVTEEVVDGQDNRVRLNFKIFDTCVSDEPTCHSHVPYNSACWQKCKAFPGGFDNGGGPRKATPSKYGYGFQFEAPRKPIPKPRPVAPFNGSWKLQLTHNGSTSTSSWLFLGGGPLSPLSQSKCVSSTRIEAKATSFRFYDSVHDSVTGKVSARLAVDDEVRAPLVLMTGTLHPLVQRTDEGFWYEKDGTGTMYPSLGHVFEFLPVDETRQAWMLLDFSWQHDFFHGPALRPDVGGKMEVMFKPADTLETSPASKPALKLKKPSPSEPASKIVTV